MAQAATRKGEIRVMLLAVLLLAAILVLIFACAGGMTLWQALHDPH
jgi:hypothetical protein